jgi:hypothetical protein
MEMSQGNHYACHFFFVIKTENRIAEQILSGGLVPVGEREDVEKCLGG